VRVIQVKLLLGVLLAVLLLAGTAHAAPISAHGMVHSCCTPDELKERVFAEANALGAEYVRVDVELAAIFEGPGGTKRANPRWGPLDDVMELSRRHGVRVLGILLAPPAYAGGDPDEFGRLAGEVAAHAGETIGHWEVLNEPDGDWAFDGTPEEYARMLSAAHDGIAERAPEAKVVLGGLQAPGETGWLERVLATPGADAIHKFDVANLHLRGPLAPVLRRYSLFRDWLAQRGFSGPVWVTEHGYAADPAHQLDSAFAGGDAAQASYLTQSLIGLAEAGAEQVFVTLRDNPDLDPQYVTEGLVRIEGDNSTRRASFDTVQRLAHQWDQVMAWRREQRDREAQVRFHLDAAAASAREARAARVRFRAARLAVHAVQDAVIAWERRNARRRRPARMPVRLARRLARARAEVAGSRAALLWHTNYGQWRRERAYENAIVAEALKRQVAGG
jgi:hypothetical protein